MDIQQPLSNEDEDDEEILEDDTSRTTTKDDISDGTSSIDDEANVSYQLSKPIRENEAQFWKVEGEEEYLELDEEIKELMQPKMEPQKKAKCYGKDDFF